MSLASESAPRINLGMDILSYLFGGRRPCTDTPLWVDIRQPSKSISACRALQWVRRLGFGLERLGLRRGDVVAICTPNHIWVPVAFLGIAGSGLVFSGISPDFTVRELAHQLSNSTAKAILAHPLVLETVLEAAAQVQLPKDRIFQFSDELCQPRFGVTDWTAMVGTDLEGDSWRWPRLGSKEAARAIAAINYSSGTTGLPKGVCVTHANLVANLEQMMLAQYGGICSAEARLDERWLGFLPLFHAYGQVFMILMAAKLGIRVYVMARFAWAEFLAGIERHRITTIHVVPPILIMLAKRPEASRFDLSSIRDAVCGAAPLSQELQNECQTRLGCQIRQAWGMTEATCACTMVPIGFRDYTGSVGRLVPHCEAKLFDDSGREVEAGRPGEVFVRGPNICLGYWRNEQATRDAIDAQGWLRTGDIAIRNDDGLMYLVDRRKDLIKVNGLQVAPAELESLLLENAHVVDAAVVGISLPARDLGEERPRAYVVVRDASRSMATAEMLQAWVASRVAKHKRLEGGVVFVDEIPKLPSGKIKRGMLKDRARREATELKERRRVSGRGASL